MIMSGVSYRGTHILSLMRRNWQRGNIKWNRYFSQSDVLVLRDVRLRRNLLRNLVLVMKRSPNASVSTNVVGTVDGYECYVSKCYH
jgi:hypothetical protein